MMYRITKRFQFEASHQLPYHAGKCRRMHGHSYKVEVSLRGAKIQSKLEASDYGMLVDFGAVSAVWKSRIFEKLDHTYLNDSLPDLMKSTNFYPTAERIAWAIFSIFQEAFPEFIEKVVIYETEDSWAEYSESQ